MKLVIYYVGNDDNAWDAVGALKRLRKSDENARLFFLEAGSLLGLHWLVGC